MTVAAKETLGAIGKMVLPRAGNPWRRLWQIPLLLAGTAAFGLGLRALIHTIRPVPFDKQAAAIQTLIDAKQYNQAIAEINNLTPYYREPLQQGRFHQLAGDSLFLAQRGQAVLVRDNYLRAEEHYKNATAWGITPTAEMNERWGEAAMALGDGKTAVEKLEAAITVSGNDPAMIQRHSRDLVAACLDAGQRAQARGIVDRMLEALKKSPPHEENEAMEQLTWCLCKRIEIALAEGDPATLKKAVEGGREALAELKEHDPKGRVLLWIGRSELETGDTAAAEKDLTEARKGFAVHHIDDGRAAVLLGRIRTARGDLAGGEELFAEVTLSHAGTPVWAAARLGRADVAARKQISGSQVLEDYKFVIATLKEMQAAPIGKKPEMLQDEVVRNSLLESYQRARDAGRFEEALTFLALEMQTEENPTAEVALRQATTRELRGRELLGTAEKLEETARARQMNEGRAMLARAADDYLQHAALVTLDDEMSGQSLWRAAGLLDMAGETSRAIAVYERLTIQRPRDPRVPEGLLALGRLYESAGMLEKAIASYQRNVRENPTIAAAYASQVNEARCQVDLAKRAGDLAEKKRLLDKAEALLLGLVQDSTNLLPGAREFHDALLSLADLYYESAAILAVPPTPTATAPQSSPATTLAVAAAPAPFRSRWRDAILRLDEILVRYPGDPQTPRTVFMLGESYHQSAREIAEELKKPEVTQAAKLEAARMERLLVAADDFSRVISLLDSELAITPATARQATGLEEQYLRTSYMERAACLFERGDYEGAIKRYSEAAARFSEETLAVEAYVQIVNAYLALKQPAQAVAAADRGRWLLKRVPESAFADMSAGGVNRDGYERLLAMGKN